MPYLRNDLFLACLGRVAGLLRAGVAKKTDARLKHMSDLLHGILLIKISTWENTIADLIGKARKYANSKLHTIYLSRN